MAVNEHSLQADGSMPRKGGVRLKTIALPAEHGGWGFLFEPIALGLLLAPSIAGLYLALSALGLFLARQPLTIVVLSRRRQSPRSMYAKRFAALYAGIALTALLPAILFAQNSFLLPLLLAAPFALVQLSYDWTGHRRGLFPEIAGAIAVASLGSALALAGGWSRPASFALWAIMIARFVPTIVYIRACLARLHGKPVSTWLVWTAHALALALVAALAKGSFAPRLGVVAMMILLARAGGGFYLPRITAKQLGFSEIGFGAMTVLAVVIGTQLGW